MSFFKRLFGRKEKTTDWDNKIVSVKDLRKHWKFRYDGRDWTVMDMSTYTWDNGVKDLEWKVKDATGIIEYLNYESTGGSLSMYKEVNINTVWDRAKKYMKLDEMADKTFEYEGENYVYLDEGYAYVQSFEEGYSVSNWLFTNEDKSIFFSFNSYEDGTKDCYLGISLSDDAVKNIQRHIVK